MKEGVFSSLFCTVVTFTAFNAASVSAGGCSVYMTGGGTCLHFDTNVPAGKILAHIANEEGCKSQAAPFQALFNASVNSDAWPRGCSIDRSNTSVVWNQGGTESFSKNVRSFCCRQSASPGDYEPAPERLKVQFNYSTTSAVYADLTKHIKDIKRRGKPLRIKVNSHPCAGKSYFINQAHNGSYMGCKLLDFDNYRGSKRTSSLFLLKPSEWNKKDFVGPTDCAALLGTAVINEEKAMNGVNEGGQFDDVAYIHVIPPLRQVRMHIKSRQAVRGYAKWANATKILEARTKALDFVFQDGVQVEPVFYTYEEGLKHCVDAYNASHIAPTSSVVTYSNLSCPFEMSKYACATRTKLHYQEQARLSVDFLRTEPTKSTLNAFKRGFPAKRVLLVGDSMMRQLFISIACNSMDVRSSKVDWSPHWPGCKNSKACLTHGVHSGFNVGSLIFNGGGELHYVPHSGGLDHIEPGIIQRFSEELTTKGKISFGNNTALEPVGAATLTPADVVVYCAGVHKGIGGAHHAFENQVKDIAKFGKQLRSAKSHPSFVYVTTPTQHFNTKDGLYSVHAVKAMNYTAAPNTVNGCRTGVRVNPRQDFELKHLNVSNVDHILDYQDLELGALHIDKRDCTHYCMPGVPDGVSARLLSVLFRLL